MFSGDCLALLSRYNWPGNVRELENMVERLVITTDEHIILPQHLPVQLYEAIERPLVLQRMPSENENKLMHEWDGEIRTLQEVIDEVEKEMIIKALQIYGSTYRAAKVLG
jgi:transcriptional regulator with PAS, ATPase and Fis domain